MTSFSAAAGFAAPRAPPTMLDAPRVDRQPSRVEFNSFLRAPNGPGVIARDPTKTALVNLREVPLSQEFGRAASGINEPWSPGPVCDRPVLGEEAFAPDRRLRRAARARRPFFANRPRGGDRERALHDSRESRTLVCAAGVANLRANVTGAQLGDDGRGWPNDVSLRESPAAFRRVRGGWSNARRQQARASRPRGRRVNPCLEVTPRASQSRRLPAAVGSLPWAPPAEPPPAPSRPC